jgi:hypothetical protein
MMVLALQKNKLYQIKAPPIPDKKIEPLRLYDCKFQRGRKIAQGS